MRRIRSIPSRVPRPALTACPSFLLYLLLLGAAILFTQLLRAPASALFFWFLLALPVASVLYLLLARLSLKVYVDTDQTSVEKRSPLLYEVKILNECIFPFSRVEANLCLPDADGVRCTDVCMELSLIPLGNCAITEQVIFPYRGTYTIGVRDLVVYDFLSLFRLRINVDILQPILVLPRRLDLTRESALAVTDVATDNTRRSMGGDRSEIGDIRTYQNGDALKDVHWKLSSKTQDLLVKQYHTNTSRMVYVLCDFSRAATVLPLTREREKDPFHERLARRRENFAAAKYRRMRLRGVSRRQADDVLLLDDWIRETAWPNLFARTTAALRIRRKKTASSRSAAAESADAPEAVSRTIRDSMLKEEYRGDMDEYCADGVVEMAIAVVRRELRAGNACTLIWYDDRDPSGVGMAQMRDPADLDAIFTRFATAPCCDADKSAAALARLVREALNVTIRVATAHLEEAALEAYGTIPAMFGGAGTGSVTEILFFDPERRYADVAAHREYVAMCRERLAHDGILLTGMHPVAADEDFSASYGARERK